MKALRRFLRERPEPAVVSRIGLPRNKDVPGAALLPILLSGKLEDPSDASLGARIDKLLNRSRPDRMYTQYNEARAYMGQVQDKPGMG